MCSVNWHNPNINTAHLPHYKKGVGWVRRLGGLKWEDELHLDGTFSNRCLDGVLS